MTELPVPEEICGMKAIPREPVNSNTVWEITVGDYGIGVDMGAETKEGDPDRYVVLWASVREIRDARHWEWDVIARVGEIRDARHWEWDVIARVPTMLDALVTITRFVKTEVLGEQDGSA